MSIEFEIDKVAPEQRAPQVTITLAPTVYEEFLAIANWQQMPLATLLRQLLEEAHRSPTTASLMRRVKAAQGLDNELTELGLDPEQIAGVKALLKKLSSRDS